MLEDLSGTSRHVKKKPRPNGRHALNGDLAEQLLRQLIKQRCRLKDQRLLALMRYDIHWKLPNDIHGRNMLRAMLACGLTGPDAYVVAPWVGDQQLDDMIRDVDSREWDSTALGNLVELENDERQRGKLWSMRPCDRNWSDVQEERRERRRERDRERKARERTERPLRKYVTTKRYRKKHRKEHARAVRLAAGATPRTQSLSRTKPWEKDGINRRAWEYRRAKAVAQIRDASLSTHTLTAGADELTSRKHRKSSSSLTTAKGRKITADAQGSASQGHCDWVRLPVGPQPSRAMDDGSIQRGVA